MKSIKLSNEERQVEADLALGNFESLSMAEIRRHSELARRDLKRRKDTRKEERINIRLTSSELAKLKERAEREGLPYQSLVASIIHKYLNGMLIEGTNLAAMKKLLKAQ